MFAAEGSRVSNIRFVKKNVHIKIYIHSTLTLGIFKVIITSPGYDSISFKIIKLKI